MAISATVDGGFTTNVNCFDAVCAVGEQLSFAVIVKV